jgi:hypothetical protein
MEMVLTCRECGHREVGESRNGLMSRIKMWNHVSRAHADRDIEAREVRLLIREDNKARMAEEAYRLQASY